MKFELRFQKAELRATEDGQAMNVSGYVNRTGELSNVLGTTTKFVEKIAPGAFARALQNATRDIDFLAEHNNKLILASTRNGSLKLTEDNNGLYMEATIAPTSWGKDYYQLIQDGILRNMSFGFIAIKDSWEVRDDGLYERTIEDLELIEVSVVRDPAYSQSSIAARGIDVVEEVEIPAELKKEQREMEELKELLKSIEERVTTLTNQFEEFRSEQKEKEKREQEKQEQEKRDQESQQASEQNPPADDNSAAQSTENPQNDQSQEDQSKENQSQDQNNKNPDKKDEDPSDDSTDESETDGDKQKDDEEDEQSRSLKIVNELSELRNILSSLK